LPLPADAVTGLNQTSQIMVEKIMAVRRDRCGSPIGRASETAMRALGRLLAFAIGVAD
jgi:mRNA interferase MazF